MKANDADNPHPTLICLSERLIKQEERTHKARRQRDAARDEADALRMELEAAAKQINRARPCKLCINREHAPIDGSCAECNPVYKPRFEWAIDKIMEARK